MAAITTNDVIVSFKKGVTWGTAVAVSSGMRLRCSQLSISGGFEEFLSRDIGFGKKLQETIKTIFNGNITVTCDLTYNQPWMALLASIMGTESTPAETTVGQADYSRTLDLANTTFGGNFWSMAYIMEDATYLAELPSVKFNSFTIQSDSNNVGTVTFSGVFDKMVVTSTTSTYANVTGVAATAPYEAAVLGGANHYFRMNANSGSALSSSNDFQIENYSFSITRPTRPQHVLRGANSKYIIEPKEIDRIDGSLTVRFGEIARGSFDLLLNWLNGTFLKAELFFDGSQIGTGVNRSQKFQFPYLQCLPALPSGYDVPNNNSLMTPTHGFRMLAATAAPAGMTSVTDYMRATIIDQRATKWTA